MKKGRAVKLAEVWRSIPGADPMTGKKTLETKAAAPERKTLTPRKFTVTERVVFHYTWHVIATSAERAGEMIDEIGDGEAVEMAEDDREVLAVKSGWTSSA